MKISEIKSCYVGPLISPEQFIPEHFFLFLAKGNMQAHDGNRNYLLKPGECCIVRKNQLARYNKQKQNQEFEKVILILDESFLNTFQNKYNVKPLGQKPNGAFIRLPKTDSITDFVISLNPLYNQYGSIDSAFTDIKREELVKLLLTIKPELTAVLFDFNPLQKINLEEFMNRNFRFNVKIERFAHLSGRSISGFKRDFKVIFNDTPNKWLTSKRLQESYFLLDKKNKKSTDVYLDLGFEDLSHFSYSFKKMFGISPRELSERKDKS